MSEAATPAAFHYHLITGEIVFRRKDSEEINAIRLNGVLADESQKIPVRLLARAQQILQANFFRNMEGQDVQVVDVVVLNFSYLGQFTTEEFHKEPEGMKLQEQAPESSKIHSVPRVKLEDAVAEAEKTKKGDQN